MDMILKHSLCRCKTVQKRQGELTISFSRVSAAWITCESDVATMGRIDRGTSVSIEKYSYILIVEFYTLKQTPQSKCLINRVPYRVLYRTLFCGVLGP
jgi:hypothetical protein